MTFHLKITRIKITLPTFVPSPDKTLIKVFLASMWRLQQLTTFHTTGVSLYPLKTSLFPRGTKKDQWQEMGSNIRYYKMTSTKFGLGFCNSKCIIWVKVFKNWPSKICDRQPLKILKLWSRPYHFKFFKGCLPQMLLGPFLNTLTHTWVWR